MFSNIALSSGAMCEERIFLSTREGFRRKTVYFTEQNVLLKQKIRIEYLIKQK